MNTPDLHGINQFRLEGEYWSIGYAGELYRLRDAKGLRYISYLLRRPGERLAATVLVELLEGALAAKEETPPASSRDPELARVKVTRAIKAARRRIGVCSAPLSAHFDASLRTGSSCSYAPDPRLPIVWELD